MTSKEPSPNTSEARDLTGQRLEAQATSGQASGRLASGFSRQREA